MEVIAVLQGWMNRSNKKLEDLKDGPPSIKTRKSKVLVAAPRAELAEPEKPNRSRWYAWALRASALLLIVGGLALIKPWSFGHRATAQTPPPPPPVVAK
jgi:hypothetical protein